MSSRFQAPRIDLGSAVFVLALAGLSIGLTSAGCRTRARVYASTATPASVRLAAIGPNVWVVANSADPVFYADGAYWYYDGGGWYTSSYVGGWSAVRVSAVPPPLIRIDRPQRYRRYQPPPRARVRVMPTPRARGGSVRVRPGRHAHGARVRVRSPSPRRMPHARGADVRVRAVRPPVRGGRVDVRGSSGHGRHDDRRHDYDRGRGHDRGHGQVRDHRRERNR